MGQYYNAVIEVNGNKEVFYHQVDGEYMMAKLLEHSYWANPFVLAIASKLWRTKGKLAWVGDYAEDSDFNWNEAFSDAHAENVPREDLTYNGFRLEGKFFINHDKKMIIDLDEYKNLLKDIEMIVNDASRVALRNKSKITMSILEDVIARTKPSLSKSELDKYIQIKAAIDGNVQEKPRRRVGFK